MLPTSTHLVDDVGQQEQMFLRPKAIKQTDDSEKIDCDE